jgi:hypothetical protein
MKTKPLKSGTKKILKIGIPIAIAIIVVCAIFIPTLYKSNNKADELVVEIEYSSTEPISNYQDSNTIVYVSTPMGVSPSFLIDSDETTIQEKIGHSLYCENGSSVIFKIIHAPNGNYEQNGQGIGYMYKHNSNWYMFRYSLTTEPLTDARIWPDVLVSLKALSNT